MEHEEIDAWEEPPSYLDQVNDPRARYTEVVKSLRENKGKWAKLAPRPDGSSARALSGNIRRGGLASFAPQGAFESKYDGVTVWVRYVGEPDGVEAPKKMVKLSPGVAKAVRTWARATGRPVSDNGRLPTFLVDEWRKATRGEGGGDQ